MNCAVILFPLTSFFFPFFNALVPVSVWTACVWAMSVGTVGIVDVFFFVFFFEEKPKVGVSEEEREEIGEKDFFSNISFLKFM